MNLNPQDQDALARRILADELALSVAARLMPILDRIREDMYDYICAIKEDRKAEVRTPTPHLISPNAAAKKFGISAYTLRREFHAGRIEGRYVGAHMRLAEESVARWCVARDQPNPQSAGRLVHNPPQCPMGKRPPSFI